MVNRSTAVAAGLVADLVLGEPPVRPHPVAAFGTLAAAGEQRWYRDSRAAGVGHMAAGSALGAAAGYATRSPLLATYIAAAPRGLFDAARAIDRALAADDLVQARELLPTLVGRDPSSLDASEIARAVVESVAENTVDAIVAPAFWGVVAGPIGVGVHRAINTLDAMVGHHNDRYERFGWASARVDDAMAWIPARATAALVIAVRPRRAYAVARAVRDDAPAHPSPNAGVAEAAFAAALGIRLGGPLQYGTRREIRPTLGVGRAPEPGDIGAAVRLARDLTWSLISLLGAYGLVWRRQPTNKGNP